MEERPRILIDVTSLWSLLKALWGLLPFNLEMEGVYLLWKDKRGYPYCGHAHKAFRCEGCRELHPWEKGCADDQEELCDDCWVPSEEEC